MNKADRGEEFGRALERATILLWLNEQSRSARYKDELTANWPALAIVRADFLATPPCLELNVDRVVMNPPFSAGQDMAHVTRAFELLNPGGRLVSIMSPHWTFAADKRSIAFRAWQSGLGGDWTALPQGAFSGSGTGVSSGILVLDKPEAG